LAIREELLLFVRSALERGLARPQIETALLAAGWRPEEVAKALGAFADTGFPIPVPRPKPYLSARETFLYLLQFTALYTSAINLGRLVFLLVDRALPDPAMAQYGDRTGDGIRWSIASLVIAFPIFLLVSRSLQRAAGAQFERRGSKVRKWLTYLTLFIAAAILTGDLISLVYNLLGGELTTRFLLKAAAAGLIAGSVFVYYLWDLRGEEREPE
jgi:O-antigen/teichoic acid export membrane protein